MRDGDSRNKIHFSLFFVKFSTTHNRLVLVCDLTNVVQIYVNNFTVTDNASSKGSFVSALNSKGPLSSSSRRTNWAKISTRKICHCWWCNHTGCVRDRDRDQDLYCAETFHTVSGTKTGHLKVQRQPVSAKVQDIFDCHSKQVWRCREEFWRSLFGEGQVEEIVWGAGGGAVGPCTVSVAEALYRDPPVNRMTDRQTHWKHYLSATSLACSNNLRQWDSSSTCLWFSGSLGIPEMRLLIYCTLKRADQRKLYLILTIGCLCFAGY